MVPVTVMNLVDTERALSTLFVNNQTIANYAKNFYPTNPNQNYAGDETNRFITHCFFS